MTASAPTALAAGLLLAYARSDAITDADCAVTVEQFRKKYMFYNRADWSAVLGFAVQKARHMTVRAVAAHTYHHDLVFMAHHGLEVAAAANNGMVHVVLTAFFGFHVDLPLTSSLCLAIERRSIVDVALLLACGAPVDVDTVSTPTAVPDIARLLAKAAQATRSRPCLCDLRVDTLPTDDSELLANTLAAWGSLMNYYMIGTPAGCPPLKDLYSFCERLFMARIDHEEDHAAVNGFLQKCHKFVVWHLEDLQTPLRQEIQCLMYRLFLERSHDIVFLNRYGGCRGDSEAAQAVAGAFGRVPHGGASRYFVDNLNYFGHLGGFELMIRRIEQEAPLLPLQEVIVFLTCITQCQFCLTKDAALRLVPRLQHAIVQRVMTLVDTDIVGPFRQKLVQLFGLVKLRTTLQATFRADADGAAVLHAARDEQHAYLDHIVWLFGLRHTWMTACVAIALDAAAAAAPTSPLLQCMLVRHSGAGMCIIPAADTSHRLFSEYAGLVAAFL